MESIRKSKISMVISIICIIGVSIVMFVGSVNVKCEEESFSVSATFWGKTTIKYSEIDSIEYNENDNIGTRTIGFKSFRLLLGGFKNDEFGEYTRYSYSGCDACIVINYNGKTVVINGEDAEKTKAIYDEIINNKSKN